jgi:hypothetical protein
MLPGNFDKKNKYLKLDRKARNSMEIKFQKDENAIYI